MGARKPVKTPSRTETVFLASLLHGELYGLQLRQEYERRMQKRLPLGSLYVTLDRMEEAGFVKSRYGESSHERGGNRRKYFSITGVGRTAYHVLQSAIAPIEGAPAYG